MFDVKADIAAIYDKMIGWRRDFHRHPELGLKEFRTSGIIEQHLLGLGLEVRRCAGTGVIGVLKGGKPGKTVMLRADIDALPVTEETGLPFASENPGVMHACGHDGHISMQMAAAEILAAHKEEIAGTVVFLFQLNEEDAGAERMIADGALDNPRPDAIFGMHLWSPYRTGQIAVVPGPIMASSYYFKLTVRGRGGHGGAPHTAINPITTAMHVMEAIKTFQTEELNLMKPTVISVGMFHAGVKEIIIPDTCELQGSIRCLHDGDTYIHTRMREIAQGVCAAYRCTCTLDIICGNTMLDNDDALTAGVVKVAEEIVGRGNIVMKDVAVMLGEDFAEFTHRVPGCYFFVGTTKPGAQMVEHHNCRFVIDEDSMPIGVEMLVRCSLDFLG